LDPSNLTPKLVKKEIHGQEVWVKVYPARYAAGQRDGESNYTRFHFDKEKVTKSGLSHATAMSMKKFGKSGKKNKRPNPK
jgi:hypothetical protein